jgi:chromosome segregation ATPase
MPVIRNRHILWAASLCSAGGVLLGVGALIDRSRSAAELDGLKAKLSESQGEASRAREELKNWAEHALDGLGKSVEALHTSQETTVGKLDEVSRQFDRTKAEVGSISGKLNGTDGPLSDLFRRIGEAEKSLATIQSALQGRGNDLRALRKVFTPLGMKPWRRDVDQPLARQVGRLEERLDEILKQQIVLMEHLKTDPQKDATTEARFKEIESRQAALIEQLKKEPKKDVGPDVPPKVIEKSQKTPVEQPKADSKPKDKKAGEETRPSDPKPGVP